MADYVEHPRTIVLSSHELTEVEDLIEDVIVLVGGRLVVQGSADEVRARFSSPGRVGSLTDVLVALEEGARS